MFLNFFKGFFSFELIYFDIFLSFWYAIIKKIIIFVYFKAKFALKNKFYYDYFFIGTWFSFSLV